MTIIEQINKENIKSEVPKFNVGDTVKVSAVPDDGYELVAIKVDGNSIEGTSFTATGNHIISAVFQKISFTMN